MNQQVLPLPREHHFYVAIAKFLFYHPEHGIVTVCNPIKIKDAEQYQLSPIILYGLTVAGLPIRWMTFTSICQPMAFQDILLRAWRTAEGLRGQPDILRVNRHLVLACPELVRDMEKIGIQVEVADAREKSVAASLRSAQDSCWCLLGKHNRKDQSLGGAIQALCLDAQYDHDFHLDYNQRGSKSNKMKEKLQQWLALPTQRSKLIPTGGGDWELGPWLSSWESALPPNPPRYFDIDSFNGRILLLTGEKVVEEILGYDGFYDRGVESAKNLVACWPNPPAEIAKCLGITLRELQWFTSGKYSLDRDTRFDLEDLLGIEYDEDMGSAGATGPYVLVAHKSTALKEVYEDISGGGDASPCEIIPHQGIADPSWRYVLINSYGKPPSIVMSPRGAKITERLPDLLMNYAGIIPVSLEFYRDVVSTCARTCREPSNNIREMTDFARRYEKHWTNCYWQPQ